MIWTACNESWHQGHWIYEHKRNAYFFSLQAVWSLNRSMAQSILFWSFSMGWTFQPPLQSCFKFDPHVINWHVTVVFRMVRVLKLGHVVFKSDHICMLIEIGLSWCLSHPLSLNVILYVHNVRFAWNTPNSSMHHLLEHIHVDQDITRR